MTEPIQLRVNGKPVNVPAGTIVAAAVALAGCARFRRSVLGQPRGPLCGMGICMECRVTINGLAQCRSCQTLCEAGMEIQTNECVRATFNAQHSTANSHRSLAGESPLNVEG